VSAIEDMLDEIDHEGMLALVIDGVLASSKEYRKATKRALRLQRRLRKAVNDKQWAEFMQLEEAMKDRAAVEAELLVRWAFAAATRSRRRP
jgi:hypothetical protein